MVGQMVRKIYKYENVELESGAVITAREVHIVDGKVRNINSGEVRVDNKNFSFSINPYYGGIEPTDTLTYNLNNVPQDIDGQAIVKEFVEFVERDI